LVAIGDRGSIRNSDGTAPRNPLNDWALLEVDVSHTHPSYGLCQAGWDSYNYSGNTTLPGKTQPEPGSYTIHHPRGDVKKFARPRNLTVGTSGVVMNEDGSQPIFIVTSFLLPPGTTETRAAPEPGSSGSPLFDVNHRVYGIAHKMIGPVLARDKELVCTIPFVSVYYNPLYGFINNLRRKIKEASENQSLSAEDRAYYFEIFASQYFGYYLENTEFNNIRNTECESASNCFNGIQDNCEEQTDCGCVASLPQWVGNQNCQSGCGNNSNPFRCPKCRPPNSNGGPSESEFQAITNLESNQVHCWASGNITMPFKVNSNVSENSYVIEWLKDGVLSTDISTIHVGNASPTGQIHNYTATLNAAAIGTTFPHHASYQMRIRWGTLILGIQEVGFTIYKIPTVNAGDDRTICLGSSVSLGGSPTATGGTGNYSYHWTSDNTTASAWLTRGTRYSANPSFVPTVAGTYTYTLEA
jgi:hypothetical protein